MSLYDRLQPKAKRDQLVAVNTADNRPDDLELPDVNLGKILRAAADSTTLNAMRRAIGAPQLIVHPDALDGVRRIAGPDHEHGRTCSCLNCSARRAFVERLRDSEPLALNPPLGVPIYADETISPGRFILRHHRPMTDEQRRDAVAALRGRIVEATYGS